MLSIFFIGLAVSMDAFSLSISIGTTNIKKKEKVILAAAIAVMHFIMPQIGILFGSGLFRLIPINMNFFNIIIFVYLGIVMLLKKEEEKNFKYSLLSAVILAICVSLDSFSIGLGLTALTSQIFMASVVFALLSGTISYTGLILGEKISYLLKEKATIFGATILFLLAIVNLMK